MRIVEIIISGGFLGIIIRNVIVISTGVHKSNIYRKQIGKQQ